LLLVHKDSIWICLLPTCAGALGSMLSGILNLRGLRRLTDLRVFEIGMVVQPLIGAAAGLFLFLLIESGVLSGVLGLPRTENKTGEGSILGTYGFIAGFSEPFLLGIVRRVAGAAEENAESR